jgi:hypothetical protein
MSRPQLLSGARGIIKVGNNALAFVADIIVNIREGVRQTYLLGRMNPGVIDSLSYDVDVSIGRVYPINASNADADFDKIKAGKKGIDPTDQSGITVGIETIIAQMTSADDLEIVIEDRNSTTISHVHNARFSGRSFTMMAGDVAQERYNFVGIYDSGYGDGEHTASIGYDPSVA